MNSNSHEYLKVLGDIAYSARSRSAIPLHVGPRFRVMSVQ